MLQISLEVDSEKTKYGNSEMQKNRHDNLADEVNSDDLPPFAGSYSILGQTSFSPLLISKMML